MDLEHFVFTCFLLILIIRMNFWYCCFCLLFMTFLRISSKLLCSSVFILVNLIMWLNLALRIRSSIWFYSLLLIFWVWSYDIFLFSEFSLLIRFYSLITLWIWSHNFTLVLRIWLSICFYLLVFNLVNLNSIIYSHFENFGCHYDCTCHFLTFVGF